MNEMEPMTSPTLRLRDLAPDFRARTTLGDITLSDYRGKWLIFFSHPADFTPVCTTEFIALAKRAQDFAALNVQLLGLSVDSLNSHIAWVRAIRDQFDIEIPFPIIEDPSMAIGRAYGMIDQDATNSATMRTSFFIDPQGVIRATTCYPHEVGRSVDEMLRLVTALQTVDDGGALAPEGWQPGMDLMAIPDMNTANITDDAQWFCRKLEQ